MKELIEVSLLKRAPYWGRFRRLSVLFGITDGLLVIINAIVLAYLLSRIIEGASALVQLLPFLGIYFMSALVRSLAQGRRDQAITAESRKISVELRQRSMQTLIEQSAGQLLRSKGKDLVDLPIHSSRQVNAYLRNFLSQLLDLPYTLLIYLLASVTIILTTGFTNYTIAFLLVLILELGWVVRSLTKEIPTARDCVGTLKGLEVNGTTDHEESPLNEEDSARLSSLGRIKELRWTDCLIEGPEGESVTFPWGIASSGKLTLIQGQATLAKTRLLETLIGIHQPVQGRFFIETNKGTFRLTELDPSYWSDQLGWLSANPLFLPGTIEENLRLIKPRTNRQKMLEILLHAGITEDALPQGLSTRIDGTQLPLSDQVLRSLALARILLKDPPIVVAEQRTIASEGDPEKSLMDRLKGLARSGKMVLILGESDYLRTLADRVITIDSNDAQPQMMLESAV